MKLKKHYLEYSKKLFSLVLVLALIVTSMPSTFFTPVFADEYTQKGRFLVAYEKGTYEVNDSLLRSVSNKEESEQNNKVKNGEIISEGEENIALVNDSKMGISSTFRKDKILAIEEDSVVLLLDDENTEVLAEETEEVKNSLDKYIIDSKGENIKIALIDSGVNTENTGIILAGGKSFIDDNYDVDENGHGTSLAGIIKGYESVDGTKFEGLAPNAELYSLKVLNEDGKGWCYKSTRLGKRK